MAELNEAQAVLSDPEKRVAYDALGSQPAGQRDFRPPPNWDAGFEFSDGAGGAGGDYSDFFEQLFGRARHAGGPGSARGRHREPQPERGTDHHAKIELDLLDAYNGAERNISLRGARLDASRPCGDRGPHAQCQDPQGRDRRPADPPGRPGRPGPCRRPGRRPVPRSVFQARCPLPRAGPRRDRQPAAGALGSRAGRARSKCPRPPAGCRSPCPPAGRKAASCA